jgi:hypothetical protein
VQQYALRTSPTNADTGHDGTPDATNPKPLFNPAVPIPIIMEIVQ